MSQVINFGSSVRVISEDGTDATTQLFEAGIIAEDTPQALAAYLVSMGPTGFLAKSGTVNVLDYMTPDATNASVQLAALQAAVNAAFAQGKMLWIPPTVGLLRINGTASIPDGGISIGGGGKLYSTADAPVFKTLGGGFLKSVGDFTVEFQNLSAPPVAACALEISGPGDLNFFQHCRIHDITTLGARSTVIVTKGTRPTISGLESNCDWNRWDNLAGFDGSYPQSNLVWFKAGSGTGQVFSNAHGQLGAAGATYFLFEGADCVVGDILVNSGHFQATYENNDAAVLGVGPNTVYRANIAITGCQTDAAMSRVFRLSNVGGVPYNNVVHEGSLIGGGTTLGIVTPIKTGRLVDRDCLTQVGGTTRKFDTTGVQNVQMCNVTLLPFAAAMVEFSLSGAVGGVNSGNVRATLLIRSDGTTSYGQISNTLTVPAGLASVSLTVAGLVTKVVVTITPTAGGTNLGATWKLTGVDALIAAA